MTKVLYAEDNEAIRETFGYLLGCDCDLHMEINGQSALKYLTNNQDQVDAIITDYQMPEMDGLELTRRAREFGFEGPIIVMSGKLIEKEALEAGASRFLEKPVTYKKAKETLDELLNGAQK